MIRRPPWSGTARLSPLHRRSGSLARSTIQLSKACDQLLPWAKRFWSPRSSTRSSFTTILSSPSIASSPPCAPRVRPARTMDSSRRRRSLARRPTLIAMCKRSPWLLGETPLLFTEHHAAHAASAFYPSPFESAAILTMDGVGEWATTSIGVGRDRRSSYCRRSDFPHSLGLLYSAFTYYCGFKVNSGEYKLMGLAPYGEPRYADLIREHLIDIQDDGSYRSNLDYFGFQDSVEMTNERFHELFGGAPRTPESRSAAARWTSQPHSGRHRRCCAPHREPCAPPDRRSNLVMAGGVALNCVANGLLERAEIFDHLWLQPAAGDAGGALARHSWFRITGSAFRAMPCSQGDRQRGSYLGPSFSSAEVESFLTLARLRRNPGHGEREGQTVAAALADGAVVGYFVGRMEFGPRALGARSILGDPAESRDADDDEPKDQVPGVLQTLCSGGPC